MKTYEKMYEENERTSAHRQTAEVEAAEQGITEMSCKMKEYLPEEMMFELDMKIGVLARAYEKQGFAFAMEV